VGPNSTGTLTAQASGLVRQDRPPSFPPSNHTGRGLAPIPSSSARNRGTAAWPTADTAWGFHGTRRDAALHLQVLLSVEYHCVPGNSRKKPDQRLPRGLVRSRYHPGRWPGCSQLRVGTQRSPQKRPRGGFPAGIPTATGKRAVPDPFSRTNSWRWAAEEHQELWAAGLGRAARIGTARRGGLDKVHFSRWQPLQKPVQRQANRR